LDHLAAPETLLARVLRQNVSELILGVDVVGFDESLLNAVANEVYLNWICLLHSWKTGFLLSASADLLSIMSSTHSAFLPISSPSSLASQTV
jgi:hypothetical protein